MARLYLDRRAGWKAIYRSIQAISDGVAAKQRLDEVEFARIQEWIESGAANLFSIQRDLARAIARLGRKVVAIDAQIARCSAALDLSSRRRRPRRPPEEPRRPIVLRHSPFLVDSSSHHQVV